jgi:hypothetical protein
MKTSLSAIVLDCAWLQRDYTFDQYWQSSTLQLLQSTYLDANAKPLVPDVEYASLFRQTLQ